MILSHDEARRAALIAIVQLPDEDAMAPRTHVVTVPGDPLRFQQIDSLKAGFLNLHTLDWLNERGQ